MEEKKEPENSKTKSLVSSASEEGSERKKKINYSAQGKRNRAAGVRFEAKVRENLEGMGWIVNKWMNNIDYEKNKVVPAKRKYNPYKKVLAIGTGFPDFMCFRKADYEGGDRGEVLGIEVKRNSYLDKVEKGMCIWLLENKVFSRILIAKAVKNGRKVDVEYEDFEEKYKKEFDKGIKSVSTPAKAESAELKEFDKNIKEINNEKEKRIG